MKGISKETLSELFNKFYDDEFMRVDQLETLLIEACVELSPWLPIADAPKDRPIAVYCPPYQDLESLVSKCQWHDSAGFCVDELRTPTLWKELPPDQKEMNNGRD